MPTFPASRLADIAPFHVMELLARAKALEAGGRTSSTWNRRTRFPDARANHGCRPGKHRKRPRVLHASARSARVATVRSPTSTRQRYGISVPASRIVVTAGASGALLLAMACLCRTGQRMAARPTLATRVTAISSAALKAVPMCIPVGAENNFQPTPADSRHTGPNADGWGSVRLSGQPDRDAAWTNRRWNRSRICQATPGTTDRR
jgi:aspartate/methionine/tyrosine aminotransferase